MEADTPPETAAPANRTARPAGRVSALPAPVKVTRRRRERRWSWWDYAEWSACALAFAVWARVVAGDGGGRDGQALTYAVVAGLPALLLTRPWRRLRNATLVVAAVVPVAAVVVMATAPYGWSGWNTAAEWTWASMAGVVCAAYASTPGRRAVLATAVVLAGLDQFSQGWLAWWGGENPAVPMSGTLAYYNPFGAYMIAPALLGTSLGLLGRGRIRLLGWVAGPVCVAGVVLSTSRASIIATGVGLVVLAVATVVFPRVGKAGRIRETFSVVRYAAVATGLLFLTTSSLAFPKHPGRPWSGLLSRAAGGTGTDGSLGDNAHYRVEYWKAAVGVFRDRPVVGTGFGGYAEASVDHLPLGMTTLSAYAHNGVLQAFSDGGVVFGGAVLAVLVGGALAAVGALRGWFSSDRDKGPYGLPVRAGGSAWVVYGAPVAAAALVAHGLVDFDWAWPSDLAMAFVVVVVAGGSILRAHPPLPVVVETPAPDWDAIAVAGDPEPSDVGADTAPTRAARPARSRRPLVSAVATAVVVLLSVTAVYGDRAWVHANTTISHLGLARETKPLPAVAAAAEAAQNPVFPDPRLDSFVVHLAAPADASDPAGVPVGVFSKAYSRGSARIAEVSGIEQLARARAVFALGNRAEGIAMARVGAARWAPYRPSLLTGLTDLLYADGRSAEATTILAAEIKTLATQANNPGGALYLAQSLAAQTGTTSAPTLCAVKEFQVAFPSQGLHITGLSAAPHC